MTAGVDATGHRTSAGDLGSLLAVLREHAVALAASGPQPPSRVRVEAAGVVVELGWPAPPVSPQLAGAMPTTVEAPDPVPAAVPVVTAGPERNGASGPGPATAPAGHRITAPTVGVFYRAPEPGASPFVAEGDAVAAGQQVAIVEAMKLMIPVEADRAGRVVAVLCADGEPVEFGQPVLVLEAS